MRLVDWSYAVAHICGDVVSPTLRVLLVLGQLFR